MPECLPDLPRYIRRLPDGSWLGAPGKHGPWRSIPAPQQALPWPTDGPAVPERREPASVAPDAARQSRPLSPARAILAAFRERYDETLRPGPFVGRWQAACLAVALEALADQVAPMPDEADQERIPDGADRQESIRLRILRIAAELEGQS